MGGGIEQRESFFCLEGLCKGSVALDAGLGVPPNPGYISHVRLFYFVIRVVQVFFVSEFACVLSVSQCVLWYGQSHMSVKASI